LKIYLLLQENITTSASQKRYEKRYEPVRSIGNESSNCFVFAGEEASYGQDIH